MIVDQPSPAGEWPAEAREALAAFDPSLAEAGLVEVGDGHIHRTWQVGATHMLQRLNGEVFRHPERILANAAALTAHLDRCCAAAGEDPVMRILRHQSTREGARAYRAADGALWRLMPRLPGSTRGRATTSDEIYRAAEAFGRFARDLSGLDPGAIEPTIPDFHNLASRVGALEAVVGRVAGGRLSRVASDLEVLRPMIAGFAVEPEPPPQRLVHNDAKLSNLLWVDDRVQAVIDWDTVMPGRLRDDYGDLLRTFATSAAEDEPDLERVEVRWERVEAVTRGYLAGVGDLATPAERENMARRAAEITVEQAVRFLTDYLEDDRYYRVRFPEHNLVRARNQMHLAAGLLRERKRILALVRRVS